MSLQGIARETLRICEAGEYVAPSGRAVSIRDARARAVEDTALHEPDGAIAPPRIEVTAEKTGAASRAPNVNKGHVLMDMPLES